MFFSATRLPADSLCTSLQMLSSPIFPVLFVPVKHPSNQRGCLALVHLFQHDGCVSKKDLFDKNGLSLLGSLFFFELYLTFILPSATVYYISPTSHFFLRHFHQECPVSSASHLACFLLVWKLSRTGRISLLKVQSIDLWDALLCMVSENGFSIQISVKFSFSLSHFSYDIKIMS